VTSTKNEKPLVIYIPGLYGSILKRKENSKDEWNLPITLLSSLITGNCGHNNLSLPITWSRDDRTGIFKQDEDDIYAFDCLNFSKKSILSFIHELHNNKLIEFEKIPWDWRRGFEETVQTISNKIINICNSYRDCKVILVTHSSGMTLAWPTVNKYPELFSSWISVAGCTMGSNYFLKELQFGWDVPKIKFVKILSKEVLFTFTSHVNYQKSSEEDFGGEGDSDFVSLCDGEKLRFLKEDEIDFFKVDDWEKFKLGIFGWKTSISKAEITFSLFACFGKAISRKIFFKERGTET